MLRVSERASVKLKELLEQNPGKLLTVVFEGFGWGGPKLGLALEEPLGNEKLHEFGGIGFSISESVLPYTSGQEIDYVTLYGNEGFLIAHAFGKSC